VMFVWPQRRARRYHGTGPAVPILLLAGTGGRVAASAASATKSTAARAAVAATVCLRKLRRVSPPTGCSGSCFIKSIWPDESDPRVLSQNGEIVEPFHSPKCIAMMPKSQRLIF